MRRKAGLVVVVLSCLVGAGAIAGAVLVTDHHHDGVPVEHTRGVVNHSDIVNHSGGLDSCGGHHNRKTGSYHYHRGPFC